MNNQIPDRIPSDGGQVIRFVGLATIHTIIALQILTFGGKLNLNQQTLSITLLAAMSILYCAVVYQRRTNPRHVVETVQTLPRSSIWGRIAVVTLLLIVTTIALGKPFDRNIGFPMLTILIVGYIAAGGLFDIRKRYRMHHRYSPLVCSVLGTVFYSIAVICVFERDAFVHLPIILQSHPPAFLEFTYVTLTFFIGGAVATIASQVWEARLIREV